MHLLTVTADADFAAVLNSYLGRFGYAMHSCAAGAGLRDALAAQTFDLVLLDLVPRDANALAPAHELRLRTRTPFIVLGSNASSADRIAGLDSGAADYLAKPFEPRELVARVRSVLRRAGGKLDTRAQVIGDATLHFDGWVLQTLTRRLTSPSGEPVTLSAAEFQLLHTFLRSPQRLLSREHLMLTARGREGAPFERSIDLLVSRLRQKLAGGTAAASMIRTVRGQGYQFEARPTRSAT